MMERKTEKKEGTMWNEKKVKKEQKERWWKKEKSVEDRKRLEFSHSPSSRRPPTQLKLQLPLTNTMQMILW